MHELVNTGTNKLLILFSIKQAVDEIRYHLHICRMSLHMSSFWCDNRKGRTFIMPLSPTSAVTRKVLLLVNIDIIIGTSETCIAGQLLRDVSFISSLHKYYPKCPGQDTLAAHAHPSGSVSRKNTRRTPGNAPEHGRCFEITVFSLSRTVLRTPAKHTTVAEV